MSMSNALLGTSDYFIIQILTLASQEGKWLRKSQRKTKLTVEP
jgi:hypothetical protein